MIEVPSHDEQGLRMFCLKAICGGVYFIQRGLHIRMGWDVNCCQDNRGELPRKVVGVAF